MQIEVAAGRAAGGAGSGLAIERRLTDKTTVGALVMLPSAQAQSRG